MSMPQRRSSAATRRASRRSGVIRAAVCASSSKISRIIIAMDKASCWGPGAFRTRIPANAFSSMSGRKTSAAVAGGRSAAFRTATRPVSFLPSPAQTRTSAISTFIRRSRLVIPYCEWPGPSASRLFTSRDLSSPGNTTDPPGRPATQANRSAVAGMLPVDPAAITGPAGGFACHSAICASISRLRRSAGSIQPCSSRMAGQFSVTIFRNSSVSCQ